MTVDHSDPIREYLKVSQQLWDERIFHGRGCAEALVGKVTYHQHKGKDPGYAATQKATARVSDFTGQTRFLERLIEDWTSGKAGGTVSMIIGESGLGKTWLMGSLFRHVAQRRMTDETAPIPILASLRGQDLMGNERRLAGLRQSFEERGMALEDIDFALEQIRVAMPPETSAGQRLLNLLFPDTGLRELAEENNVLILLDGLNEMPGKGKQNLQAAITELRERHPGWEWVISGQPQVVEEVSWVKDRRPLYDEGGKPLCSEAWAFYEVQEVTEDRVRDYLNIHLGQGQYQELEESLLGYLREFDDAVRRNPRYLYHICQRLKKTGDLKALPTTGGELLDEVVTEAIVAGLPPEKATSEEVTIRKILLGCIALYEVLSAGKLLQWEFDPAFPERHVTEWLRGFTRAAVLPISAATETLISLRAVGPWGYSPDSDIVFDHDTTRDYAVAYLLKYLLEDSKCSSDEGFLEFMVLLLVANRFMSKSIEMFADILNSIERISAKLHFTLIYRLVVNGGFNKECLYLYEIRDFLLWLIEASSRSLRKRLSSRRHRRKLIDLLASFVSYPAVRDLLLRRLGDEDESVRRAAAKALASVAAEAEVRDALLRELGHEDWRVRQVAAKALAPVVAEAEVRDVLLRKLEDEDESVRAAAAEALTPAAAEAEVRDAFLRRLEDQDEWTRAAAAKALASVAAEAEVRDALLRKLEDEHASVRAAAAEALTPAAADAEVRDALLRRLEDQDKWAREAAAKALAPVAAKAEVRDALLRRLDDQDEWIRETAAKALAPAAAEAEVRDAFLRKLEDEDESVRRAAAKALASVAAEAEVRDGLLRRLEDQDEWTREAAAKALAPAAAEAEVRDAFLRKLEDEDKSVRRAAAETLAPAAGEPEVRDALLAKLDDNDSWVRQEAAEALAPRAKKPEVRDALLRRLEDEEKWVRKSAAKALASAVAEAEVRDALLWKLADKELEVSTIALDALMESPLTVVIPKDLLPKLRDYGLFRHAVAEHVNPGEPKASFWRDFVWAFSPIEALTHALTFYMNPAVFVSVLNSIPKVKGLQLSHYAVLDGQTRHTARREDKRQFFSELKGHFPLMTGRIPCPALCIDGKPVFFNYATFCLAHLVPDVERFDLLKDPDVRKTLQEIFEDHVIAAMGFPAGRVAELCEEPEILFSPEDVQYKTAFGSWKVFKNQLSNLIANARIHKESVCRVMVTESADSKVKDPVIMVLDDGKGFPADKEGIEKLFKRGMSRTPGGSGNGLTEDMVREFGGMGFSVCLRNCEGQWFCFEKSPTGDHRLSGPTPIPDPIAHEKQAIEAITHSSGAVVAIMR